MADLPSVPARIEDYALLSDCGTAALVSRAGSIDWLCWPRFDSDACLAALLGDHENGRWQICPAEPPVAIHRHYRDGSTILETIFETACGAVALIDFMPLGATHSSIVRILEGRGGSVSMQMRLKLRFDYGTSVPWVTRLENEQTEGLVAVAGPNLVVMRCDVPTEGRDLETVADFTIAAGQSLNFTMRHGPSHLPVPPPLDARAELDRTEADWHKWSDRCAYDGDHADIVKRSLITLKSLTYDPTGGIVAAPTTSLPEAIGGARNWDYRYCWLRDATFTLLAFMLSGYYDEAQAWGLWLHRSIAGSADQLQIMYGIAGERRLDEWEVGWLSGYENSKPVRIGNAAAGQVQLDVYGEVMGSMRQLRLGGMDLPDAAWSLQRNLLDRLSDIWRDPDEGLWEVRGQRRHFTFSKMMAWSAYNYAIADAEDFKLDAPLDVWRAERDELHALICEKGFHPGRNSFTQSFGVDTLDASLLLAPMIGFLPPDDPRVAGTVAAIEATLLKDGLVLRYEADEQLDGQAGGEGAFLACSFWMVNALVLQNRAADARVLFDRLVALCNDVGLLAEEYDTTARRQVGNFPQAFSHLALINSALILHKGGLPSDRRRKE